MKYVVILLLLLPIIDAHARDITDVVIQQTDLDEKIAKACNDHCQGNRRKGKLKRVTSDHISGNQYHIRIWADLKNHHHVNTGIGGGFATYEYTIGVIATGTLNAESCMLTVTDISLRNDKLGLSNLARREEGKTHHIANCRTFI